MNMSKKKKQDILPDEIKANIYDEIEIIIDFHGITRIEIEKTQEKVKSILSPDYYSRREGEFSYDELSAYGERNYISKTSLKRYHDTESVIRYYSKDETEIITINKLFLSIKLNYEVTHKLKGNILRMAQLISLFAEEEYFEVEGLYLIKKDSIYCKSLYRLYQCYNKEMFADASYLLKKMGKNILSESTSICNKFRYGKYNVSIVKSVIKGHTSYEEEIYEGKMDTTVSYEVLEDQINVEDIINDLNDISFQLFISHITEGFANDLIIGKTDKVKDGVNMNE